MKMIRRNFFGFVMWIANYVIAYTPSYWIRHSYYRLLGMSIGPGTSIQMRLFLLWPQGVTIGDHSVINHACTLDGRGGLRIGNNVSISPEVAVLTLEHDPHDPAFSLREGPVQVDDHVWIGTRAMVLPGVHLHENCVVAAGALVTKDVPPYAIVGGVPARIITTRQCEPSYELTFRRPWH